MKLTSRHQVLLEKTFDAEFLGAVNGHPALYQTRSKLASDLVAEGYLKETEEVYKGVRIKGYCLTHLGRLTCCTYY